MAEAKYTPEQVTAENEALKLRIGRAVAQWSFIESGLATWFQRLTLMHPLVSRKIFYSVSGFGARRKMLLEVINAVRMDPAEMAEYLKAIVNKAGNYSGTRNLIAHGDVVFVGIEGAKHYGQSIILQGRQPITPDMPDGEILTKDQLEVVEENFGRLGAVIALGLDWKTGESPRPIEFLELIHGLPNPAQSARLDPTILEHVPSVPEGKVQWHR